jgi:hypothetical protein
VTPLEMIAEWRRGCSCAGGDDNPATCEVCTSALIDALERSLSTTEAREGVRFREEHIIVKTTWNFTGQVEQLVLAPTGIMQRRVLDTMERQARDALTSLGWVPPAKKP